MTELHNQGIHYVRFDVDGGDIEGLDYAGTPKTTEEEVPY